MILVLGKARSHRASNLGSRGTVTWVIWCFAKKLSIRHDAWVVVLSWWSCPSPGAQSCSLLNHPNSSHRGTFKLHGKFDAGSLLYLLSHFECDGHTVHMLSQWHLSPPLIGTVEMSLFTHAHSSSLTLAVRLHRCWQTVLIILAMAEHFSRETLYDPE